MSTTVYVYTFRRGKGAWSRYVFAFDVEAFAQLGNDLYIKSAAGGVFKVGTSSATGFDDLPTPTAIPGVVQWPWLDFGMPGVTKMLHGIDIVGMVGVPQINIDYNQSNPGAAVTTTYAGLLTADTMPGTIIPIPMAAPSMSLKLSFAQGGWSLQMVNMVLQDFRNGP